MAQKVKPKILGKMHKPKINGSGSTEKGTSFGMF